jgi:hypothetical protein
MVIKEKKTMMCNDGVEQRCNGHREGRQEKKKRKTREEGKKRQSRKRTNVGQSHSNNQNQA